MSQDGSVGRTLKGLGKGPDLYRERIRAHLGQDEKVNDCGDDTYPRRKKRRKEVTHFSKTSATLAGISTASSGGPPP